ncbi:MAG: DUF4177 domain-containing protein [Pseudomonadota bacterium]
MDRFEYKVVPAPVRVDKTTGANTLDEKFANTLQSALNAEGAEGWEFVRSETMAAEDKRMLRKSAVAEVTVLIYRRLKAGRQTQTQDVGPALSRPAAALAEPDGARIPPLGPAKAPGGPDAA